MTWLAVCMLSQVTQVQGCWGVAGADLNNNIIYTACVRSAQKNFLQPRRPNPLLMLNSQSLHVILP